MKKIILFFFVCLIILPNVYANDNFSVFGSRTFEIGLNAGISFTNDFLSVGDVFQKTFVLDLDDLKDGFRMNFGLNVTPLYFSFQVKDRWGFGLTANVDAVGAFHLSGELLSLSEADDAKSEINAAVYAEIGAPVFFHFRDFKIKIRPAFYYPIVYATSDISYTLSSDGGTILNLGYDVNVYTGFPMDNDFELTTSPGVDFHIGAVYPLSEVLGLKDKIFLLDFDVGLDLINIPLVPAKMKDYMVMTGNIGNDKPINFFDENGMNLDNFFTLPDDSGDYRRDGNYSVRRPFKMLVWADWRPLGSQLLTITPAFGFAINPLYLDPFSMECGVKARLNLLNLFYATAGIGYYDRLWTNSLDLALNLKFFEFNVGADLRSQSFLNSWNASGFGVNVGLKFGL